MSASVINNGLTQSQIDILKGQFNQAKNSNLSFLLKSTNNGGYSAQDLYKAEYYDIGNTIGGVPLTTLFPTDLFGGTKLDFSGAAGGLSGGNNVLAQMDSFGGGMGGRLFQIGAALSGPNGQVAQLMGEYQIAQQKDQMKKQQALIQQQQAIAAKQLQNRAIAANNIAQQQQSQNQKMMQMFLMIYLIMDQKKKQEQHEAATT